MPMVFAFGSNLSKSQMGKRCRSMRFATCSRLHRSSLAFAGYSAGWGGAVATIVPEHEGVTLGALYEVSQSDLAILDRFEGVPFAYAREVRKVRTDNGLQVRAHTYVLRRPLGIPSTSYVAVIAAAYVRLGYATTSLGEAIVRSNNPKWDPSDELIARRELRQQHRMRDRVDAVVRKVRARTRDEQDEQAFEQWLAEQEQDRQFWRD